MEEMDSHSQVDGAIEDPVVVPTLETSDNVDNGSRIDSPLKDTQEMGYAEDAKQALIKAIEADLNIDPYDSLPSMSARLTSQIPPAEGEITRINRQSLYAIAGNRKQQSSKAVSSSKDEQSTDLNRIKSTMEGPTCTVNRNEVRAIEMNFEFLDNSHRDSLIAEEWINMHLANSTSYLLPASDIQTLLEKTNNAMGILSDDALVQTEIYGSQGTSYTSTSPLSKAGIDRASLYQLGLPRVVVDRLYRALYVYTSGFHTILKEVAAQCPPLAQDHVATNVWAAFAFLLESCGGKHYEIALQKIKRMTNEWLRQNRNDFEALKKMLEGRLNDTENELKDVKADNASKTATISSLSADAIAMNTKLTEQQHEIERQNEDIRLLGLEVLAHEDKGRKLNHAVDEARKHAEIANFERVSALTRSQDLQQKVQNLEDALSEATKEKAISKRRVHEAMFTNQALRKANESLKQNAVKLTMDKTKLESEKSVINDEILQFQHQHHRAVSEKKEIERVLETMNEKQAQMEDQMRLLKAQNNTEREKNAHQALSLVHLQKQLEESTLYARSLVEKGELWESEKKAFQNADDEAKQRIERLIAEKLNLETQLESMRSQREKDQQQIKSLKQSLETLDAEYQHSKRVFAASQQAFTNAKVVNEQLHNQVAELEKACSKATKNLSTMRKRYKELDESTKEQVAELGVQISTKLAQVREASAASAGNSELAAQLRKQVGAEQAKIAKLQANIEQKNLELNRLEDAYQSAQREKKFAEDQQEYAQASIRQFAESTQQVLALVKQDEFPLDEALRELLQMMGDSFSPVLDVNELLDEEDRREVVEEDLQGDEDEVDTEDIANCEQSEDLIDRQRSQRKLLQANKLTNAFSDEECPNEMLVSRRNLNLKCEEDKDADGTTTLDDENDLDGRAVGTLRRRNSSEVAFLSRFRKTKLEKKVIQLDKDMVAQREHIEGLEGLLCEQRDKILLLEDRNDESSRMMKQLQDYNGMLNADNENMHFTVATARNRCLALERDLNTARQQIEAEMRQNFELELTLRYARKQFDLQQMTQEDLLSHVRKEVEYRELMVSLRETKAIQATVDMISVESQTLAPQRSPAMDRTRVAALNLPMNMSASAKPGNLLRQINEASRILLPDLAKEMKLPQKLDETEMEHGSMNQLGAEVSRKSIRRSTLKTSPFVNINAYERKCLKHPLSHRRHTEATENSAKWEFDPEIIRHTNELGNNNDVLVPPECPPFFVGPGEVGTTRLLLSAEARLRNESGLIKQETEQKNKSRMHQIPQKPAHVDDRVYGNARPGSGRTLVEQEKAELLEMFFQRMERNNGVSKGETNHESVERQEESQDRQFARTTGKLGQRLKEYHKAKQENNVKSAQQRDGPILKVGEVRNGESLYSDDPSESSKDPNNVPAIFYSLVSKSQGSSR